MPRKVDPGTIRTGGGAAQDPLSGSGGSGGADSGLAAHVNASSDAHPASAISIDGYPPVYTSGNVEGALDELSALIPPKPPEPGTFEAFLEVSGIPDWGILKLSDRDYESFTSLSFDSAEMWGIWFRAPEPSDEDPPFTIRGADPVTDPTFNVEDTFALGYEGGGQGEAHSGGFTRVPGADVVQTNRILPSVGPAGNKPVVVSGVVYPADRGVLALIHWPADGDTVAFLAQSLTDRCIAAVVLGENVLSGCDGAPGGIFTLGDDGSGNFDPFAFPGSATGQYDLRELHTGLSTIDATPLPIVADPAAGQVRLGTDPNAGEPVIAGGIPILGAGTAATGGGHDQNFLRYRLPYLNDYSDASGLKFTPAAEKPRYFSKPDVALDPLVDLTQAGDYPDLDQNYWAYQMARYRHRFTLDGSAILAGDPRESGTYMLLHFKNEQSFEALVRDGVAPADEDLYSANLANWADPEDITNVVGGTAADVISASSYHLIRQGVYEDPDGKTTPTVSLSNYTFVPTVDEVTIISGVQYFVPANAGGSVFSIDSLNLDVDDLFEHSYRTLDPDTRTTVEIYNMNPLVLAMPMFTYDLDSGNPTFTTAEPNVQVRRQRIELGLDGVGFGLTNAPDITDTASFSLGTSIDFDGDVDYPAFSRNAQLRVFIRRPLGWDPTTFPFETSLPYPGVIIPNLAGDTVLFHSTRANAAPVFGNFVSGGFALSSLETADKDTNERFLDEVYRYDSSWTGVPAADQARLVGPGLPGGISTVDVPVRSGTTVDPDFQGASWLQNNHHLSSLEATLTDEAQVGGLPDRATDPEYAYKEPFQSSGVVMYPQTDYTAGHRPVFPGDISSVQFDYTTATGDRNYVRAFDVAFSRSATPLVPEGQPFFDIKISGVNFVNFNYVAPGPGSLDLAILIKVPGLTTWMDLGRLDGAGPSKQDAFVDGAGCQVNNPSLTFTDVDEETGVRFCQVRVNVGPAVNLFRNADNEVPILVKVVIKDTVGGRALDFSGSGPNSSPSGNARGVVGIEIVRPSS